jgi:hypothetical protein
VWFVSVSACPEPSSEEFGKCSGAYVNCWLLSTDAETARARALQLCTEYGWRVEFIESCRRVERSDYATDSEAVKYFDQALLDKEVVVFHTWLLESPSS